MDTGVIVALVSAAGLVGAGVTGTVVAHVLGRQTRAAGHRLATAQTRQAEAAAEQLEAEGDRIRQEIYQGITADLRTELQQVKSTLRDAQVSLAATSAEAERLRVRVVELESRIAQLEGIEQRQAAELHATQVERDQLRIQLAGKDATIAALTAQVGDLKAQLVGLTTAAPHPTHP